MTIERESPGWLPVWEGPVRGWALNFIKKNKWKVDSIYDFEDLVQEAYLVFLRVADAYPCVVDPPHFMSLFKTALVHNFTDKARDKQKKSKTISDTEGDAALLYSARSFEYNEGELRIVLAELPPELRATLRVLTGKVKMEGSKKPPKTKFQKKYGLEIRENLSMRICRFLGLPYQLDVIAKLKEELGRQR